MGRTVRPPAWTLIVAYALSFAVLAIAQRGTAEVEMTHDGAHYLQIARSLMRGEGFTTYTHWALNLPRGDLPEADTYRAPLYPILVAVIARVTSDLAGAGKWAAVVTGAFIAPLVLFFTVARLRLALGWGALAALIALTNHHLVVAGSRALTEATYTAAVLFTLCFLAMPRPRAVWAGVGAGVAWLVRYQGVTLLPCALAAFALARGSRDRWLRHTLAFTGAFLVTISPWLVRNQIVAGSPFYTELKYHVVSTYDPERAFYQYFQGLAPPEEPLSYMIKRVDRTILLFGYRLWKIAESFGRENAGNPLLFGFAIAGVIFLARETRARAHTEPRGSPDPAGTALRVIGVFMALNVGVVALTFAKHRHLTSCDPLVAALGAAGVAAALGRLGRPPRRRALLGGLLAGAVALGIATEVVRSHRKITRIEPRGLQHAVAVGTIIGEDLAPNEAVMAASPYFFAYVLDRPALSLPWSDDEGLRTLALRHDVRYVCVVEDVGKPPHPGSFAETGILPSWMFERARLDPGVRIFEIDLEKALIAGASVRSG